MPEQAKTSITHPLRIDGVCVNEKGGRIGITFCPGKKQRSAYSGNWDRDLATDLAAIQRWGASRLVTLLEKREMEELKVSNLGEEAMKLGLKWHHLPIRDVSIPDRTFEQEWQNHGRQLRECLRNGGAIVVHCKGGLGRAGTIAARLLVELGWEPEAAIRKVREVRPGAIETAEQERYVRETR